MRYKVIKGFKDLTDGGHRYKVGDDYPRAGRTESQERIDALLNGKNKAGIKLIGAIPGPEDIEKEPKAEKPKEEKLKAEKKKTAKKSEPKKESKKTTKKATTKKGK